MNLVSWLISVSARSIVGRFAGEVPYCARIPRSNMISRIVQLNVKKECLGDLRQALAETYNPRIKQQPGFVDMVQSLDAQSGQFVCMSLWKSSEDVARYDSGLFQEIATAVTPLVTDAPTVKTMTVETDTIHQVARGAVAA